MPDNSPSMPQVPIHYANVDLDIKSSRSLKPLLDEFGERIIVLYHQRAEEAAADHDWASVELNNGCSDAPHEAMEKLCKLIECLSATARDIWNDCETKDFNIGFHSGTMPPSIQYPIPAAVVRRATDLGASITFTIYAIYEDDLEQSGNAGDE